MSEFVRSVLVLRLSWKWIGRGVQKRLIFSNPFLQLNLNTNTEHINTLNVSVSSLYCPSVKIVRLVFNGLAGPL